MPPRRTTRDAGSRSTEAGAGRREDRAWSSSELPPVAELIPHAGSMVFLERVLAHRGERTRCSVAVDDQPLFRAADGSVPSWVGIEYMAQCIAAHAGLVARAAGRPVRIGFLVGARRLDLHTERFRAGSRLVVSVERVWGGPTGPVTFDCTLEDAASQKLLAASRLSCYTPEELPELGGRA